MTIRVLGLSLYGELAASTRYRLLQYSDYLATKDIELTVRSLLGDRYIQQTFSGHRYPLPCLVQDYVRRVGQLLEQHRFDVALVNAEIFPLLPGFIESRLLRIPYIYDFDDAFFLKYRQPRFRWAGWLLKNKFNPVVSRASAVLAGNHHLESFARELNSNTVFLPTTLNPQVFKPQHRPSNEIFTIGWIGSPSTSVYLQLMKEPLRALAKDGLVRFRVIGGPAPSIEGVMVESIGWSALTEVDLINSFDAGVMPLFDDPWSRGKCAFKLLQYMACGLPVIASPVGANLDVVDSTCGMLAGGPEEWLESLRLLRDDPFLRASMGAAGRKRVVQHFSVERHAPVLCDVIASLGK